MSTVADPLALERLRKIREHVEIAHREVQSAQWLAYGYDAPGMPTAARRIRLPLNRAQNILIKLLIHRLPPR